MNDPIPADASATPAPTQDQLREAIASQRPDAERQLFAYNKQALAQALRAAGFTSVAVHYSGYGDEGAVDEVRFDPEGAPSTSRTVVVAARRYTWDVEAQENIVSLGLQTASIADVAQDLCYQAIGLCGHGGFENSDGGSGTFTLQAETASAKLEHSDYYTESTDSLHAL